MGDIIFPTFFVPKETYRLSTTKGKAMRCLLSDVCLCLCIYKHAYVHMFICDLVFAYLHVLFFFLYFIDHYAVLISSTVAYVPMKEKKMKMSDSNLTPVMQVKCTLAHVHSEIKYEVWCVSPI